MRAGITPRGPDHSRPFRGPWRRVQTSLDPARGPWRGVPGALGPTGSAADYERFLPEAKQIPEREVHPMRADVNLALTNAQRGVTAVLDQKARVKKELPV